MGAQTEFNGGSAPPTVWFIITIASRDGADSEARSKFVGFNALLAAAYYCSGAEIVDFLLEKGCDPSERDARG